MSPAPVAWAALALDYPEQNEQCLVIPLLPHLVLYASGSSHRQARAAAGLAAAFFSQVVVVVVRVMLFIGLCFL